MAILIECPHCRRKQKITHKHCTNKRCVSNKDGANLGDFDKWKRKKKVRFWVSYQVDGRQKREAVGFSIKAARDAEAKRVSQKRDLGSRFYQKLQEDQQTFKEISEWHLDLQSVKRLATYDRVQCCLNNFNKVLGDRIISTIKPVDLENYQMKREEQGRSAATIDMELTYAKAVISKAFDNDLVSGHTLKVFRNYERKLKKADNARKRTMSIEEYLALTEGQFEGKGGKLKDISPPHLRAFVILAYNSGMRLGELRQLEWSHVDREGGFIRLPAKLVKERRDKVIPINHHAKALLDQEWRAARFRQKKVEPQGCVLTYDGKAIKDKGGLKRSFRTACKSAEISYGRKTSNGITFHDIRRTVKTNMVSAGIGGAIRDTILGHTLAGMDAHYVVPPEDDLSRAMTQFTEWLDNQIASRDQNREQKAKEVSP